MGGRTLVAICILGAVTATLCLGGQPRAQSAETAAAPIRWAPERVWRGDARDDGSVHCLGNGRLCVYEQGPEVIQLFGPPYSATTIGGIRLPDDGLEARSRRVCGAAVWEHRIARGGDHVATMTDFVDSELPCFVRRIEAAAPLRMVYEPELGLRLAASAGGPAAPEGLIVETPIGRPSVPFGNYPIPFAVFQQFAWRGAIAMERDEATGATAFTCAPGVSTLYVAGGPGIEECLEHIEAALAADYPVLHARTLASWRDFTAKGRDFDRELPPNVPMRDRLVQVLDDVAVMIKAQQAADGGVLAGYPYHLGYVRDQYGTHRGLVALGHEEMSRDILAFYHRVFASHGMIRNAQAFGIPGLFHVHENDDVEITGYITLQAFDYLARSGDTAFLLEIFPMLDWAWDAQQRWLVADMLPFNGDETYVAGGILPRSALNDGSAEATLLFIDSSARLLDFAGEHGLWDEARLANAREVLNRVRGAFRDNFLREGRLITNNPARRAAAPMPRARHGVCEHCNTVQWTLRTDNARYVCVDCMDRPPLPAAPPDVFTLQSVSLTPLYFHSPIFEKDELRPMVEEIVAAYEATGRLPSRPGGDASVGYDYGLLLYALTELGHPAARALYERTLALADPTGAWAEYYRDHRPYNTRCRPWESAINIEAILHWVAAEYGAR